MNIKTRKKHMNDICVEKNTLRKKKKLQSESEWNEWVVENGLTSPDQVTLHIKRLLALFFWFYHNKVWQMIDLESSIITTYWRQNAIKMRFFIVSGR